jgi:hypothetical protein
MRLRFALSTTVLATLALSGCRDASTATLQVGFDVVWNGQAYAVGDVALDDQGREVLLERLECYVSDFAVHDVDEGWVAVDTVARIDFSLPNPRAFLDLVGCDDRSIDGLRMGLGVPADRNTDVDPASYSDPEHPLGFKGSAGMHWGWAAGYIFSVYEGRLQTDPLTPFAYHTGDDTCFRSVEFMWDTPLLVGKASNDVTLRLTLDAYRCLHGDADTIDPEVDPITHTGNNLPLALRWVDLYEDAWTLNP